MTNPSTAQRVRPLKMVVAAMASGAALFCVVGAFLNGFDEAPEPLWLGILVIATVGALGAALTLGFKVPALEPGVTDPEGRALAALSSSTIMRTALAEFPAILALVLSFVAFSGYLALAGLLVVPLILWIGWPSRANVARLERSLDAKGARSGLSEAVFGPGSGPSGGPMLPV